MYDKKEETMGKSNFLACKFGRVVNVINSNYFRYNIGERINNFVILDRRREWVKTQYNKQYKIKCLKCGFDSIKDEVYRDGEQIDYWIRESYIAKYKCPCCSRPCKVTVVGINDIPTTAPWMVKYFQGGCDEAKKYTKSSTKSFYPICPSCGNIKSSPTTINNLNTKKSIGCICNDGISFPEKVVINILSQLKIKYKHQVSKKDFEWCKRYRYDFCLNVNDEIFILEVHGNQHYNGGFETLGGKDLKQEIQRDEQKRNLAIDNGIKPENYIILDCRYSELEYIKRSIMNSKLGKIISLEYIDWNECFKYATSSMIKEICSYYKNNINIATKDIANMTGVPRCTVIKYLKNGTKLGLCNYNPKEELRKNAIKNGKLNGKRIEVFDTNDISLGVFESASCLERESERIFGVKISAKKIRTSCTNENKRYEGFKFKYVSEAR